jgi:hypothetical protein
MGREEDADARARGFRDASEEGALLEEADTQEWIEAGSPTPMAMWRMLRDLPAADAPGELPPALPEQTMALLPLDLVRYYLGGISAEAFDKNVRHLVQMRAIGTRRFVSTASLREYVESGSYKSLA